MQNTSIPNSLAPLGTTPAKARTPDNSGADQQFTHMLANQLSQRTAERNAMKIPAKVPEAPKPVAAKNTPAPAGKPSEADAAPATPAGSSTPAGAASSSPAKGTTASKDSSDPADATATAALSSTDAALNASAAIMAMVANAGQPAALKADSAPALPAGTVRDIASRTDLKAAAGLTLEPPATDTALKDLAAKGASEFAATLQKADTAPTGSGVAAALLADLPAAGSILPQLQQATMPMTTPVAPHPGDQLRPAVGGNGWDQSLGQRMVWMVAGAEQSASLTLNPPDLGPLQVVLNVTNGQADASFFSALPEVRQALEAALPTLREMLGGAGISLGQASVSSGNPEQARGSQRDTPGSRGNAAGVDGVAGGAGGSGISGSTPRRINGGSGGVGMVDTFA